MMIKHIVMWKLKDFANGKSKAENAKEIKRLLENLNGKISGLIKLEVGIDHSKTTSSGDVVLYSEFESQKALNDYQINPDHEKIKPFVSSCREVRLMVDYET